MDYDYTRNQLQALFDRTGLTQKEFADLCNLTQSTVTRLLAGKRSPQLSTIVKICLAFRVQPHFFVREFDKSELGGTPDLTTTTPLGHLARRIVLELPHLTQDDLREVLDFIRFRRQQNRQKEAS